MLAAHSPPPGEVRRCGRCGQSALVVVHAWQQKIAGIHTPSHTIELQCRACGAQVVLHPATTIRAERIVGFLMLPALFPGLYFLASARRKARAWTDNPVVDGAFVSPAMGPPGRRCTCSETAVCVAIVRQGTWNLPLGRHHDYQCTRCERRFSVHDTAAIAVMSLIAILLFAVGTLVIAFPPGQAVGAAESNQQFAVGLVVFGVVATVLVALRIRGRVVHPLVGG